MHPDVAQEQEYFDRALRHRERQLADLGHAPDMAADPRAAAELRRRLVGTLRRADPDEGVAFGRIDSDGESWYVGKDAIWDDENEIVVVNWQAPIAAPFYTATPADPEGLDARRLYRCKANRILDIEELVFSEVANAITEDRPPVLSDALLDGLGSTRSGELREIVATIQAAQYELIARDPDRVLIVQGGPGTGKTVVGLHRVSWLLHNLPERMAANDVLVVGPNPTFIRYISTVLPSLGDRNVVQLPINALGPRVRIGRVDPPDLRRLKGDRRMLRVIVSALRHRQRVEREPIELHLGSRVLTIDGDQVAARARQLAARPHNEAHRELRALIIDEVRAHLGRYTSRSGPSQEASVQGDVTRAVDTYLDRAWPTLTPQAFLVDLFSTARQLHTAAAGLLNDDEIELLSIPRDVRVGSWQWSADDMPLLDAAEALLNGPPPTYEHIVVDEAQDLSPMQLESIRRRSRAGSMTLLGDLAQGTSPWAHSSWDEVALHVRRDRVPIETVELEYGYRLPVEVHDIAMRLLPRIAPHLRAPRAVRSCGNDVAVVDAEGDLAGTTIAAIRELLGPGLIGVVVPARQRARIAAALERAGLAWSPELRGASAPIVLLSAEAAKGLEFDNVIVVEPAQIVAEADHGLRVLFIAMTRCTSRLALVHDEPLPQELGTIQPGREVVDAVAAGPDPEAGPATPEPADRLGSDGSGGVIEEIERVERVERVDDAPRHLRLPNQVAVGAGAEAPGEAFPSEVWAADDDAHRPAIIEAVSPTGDRIDDGDDDRPATGDETGEVDAVPVDTAELEWGEPIWSDSAPAEPQGGVDWRKSIPREFVARKTPVGETGANGILPAPAAALPAAADGLRAAGSGWVTGSTPAGSSSPGPQGAPAGPPEPVGPPPPPPASAPVAAPAAPAGPAANGNARSPIPAERRYGEGATARANGLNGVNGSSQAHHDDPRHASADAPWSELDREIARAVAATVAEKLGRYVNGSLLPLVAEELARLVGPDRPAHMASSQDG